MAQNEFLPQGNAKGYSTVLIARFSAIGDVAMTVPVVYSVCRCYPDVRFVFITRPSMTTIFVGAPRNLIVEGVDLKETYSGIGGMHSLAGVLMDKYRPQVFIDLHDVLRTKLLSIFLRLKGIDTFRLVKPRAGRRTLTRRHNKILLPLPTQRSRYRDVFIKAGLGMTDRFRGIFGNHCEAATELFRDISAPKPEGQAWVGIAPFAAHKGKIYPPEQMERVVALLQSYADNGHDLRIFLLGGGGEERRILEEWTAEYPAATSIAGKKYGFKAEMALMNHLDVMVSMDSANMHLAAIASTPTISIWGATHPYCGFKAWRQTDDNTIQLPLDCRPCSVYGNKTCFRGDMLCLSGIKPEVVYSRIIAHIN